MCFPDRYQVWVIGSSIIRDAFFHTQDRNLHLQGIDVHWEFMPGMKTCHLYSRIYHLLGKLSPPDLIVIHVGGNDIGQSPLNNTEILAISTLSEIQAMTNAKLVWSQILPRLVYRNEQNHTKLNKARRRFNTTLARYCIQMGGAYIRHPQIIEKAYLFRDHVHLSEIGNDMFINNLKHAINAIVFYGITCFPDDRS